MEYKAPTEDQKGERDWVVKRFRGLPVQFRGTYIGSVHSTNGRWFYSLWRVHDGRWVLKMMHCDSHYNQWRIYGTGVYSDQAHLFGAPVHPDVWPAFGFVDRI